MRQLALRTVAALAVLVGVSAAQASSSAPPVCTVQYAQRSVPSTDDSIGPCLDKMLWLSVYDGNGPRLVHEISYVSKSAPEACTIDEARRQAALKFLVEEASALHTQGVCVKVELLL